MTQTGELGSIRAPHPTARQASLLAEGLLRCLERYQAALLDYEELSATAAITDPEVAVERRQIDCADQVVLARLSLFRCLVEQGWTPPAQVQDALARATAISEPSAGSLAG